MATLGYSARLTCEIQACLADIISSDAAGIVAEYSLRTEQEKLICVLKTALYDKQHKNEPTRLEIRFNTSAFNSVITKFAIQIHREPQCIKWKYKNYSIVVSGPDGEIGSNIRFNELCIDSSYWMSCCRNGILQTAKIEYMRQMRELMSQY